MKRDAVLIVDTEHWMTAPELTGPTAGFTYMLLKVAEEQLSRRAASDPPATWCLGYVPRGTMRALLVTRRMAERAVRLKPDTTT